jgi:hypothetical protein
MKKRKGNPENIKAHRFKPGQSGNPGGRPKKTPLTDELRKLANDPKNSEAAAKALFKFIRKGSYLHFREVCDRVEGKSKQRIEVTGDEGTAVKVEARLSVGDLFGAIRAIYGLDPDTTPEAAAAALSLPGKLGQRSLAAKDSKKK